MSFRSSRRMTAGDWINYILLMSICIVCVFPFIYVFSTSFTDPQVYVPLQFRLVPEKWSLEAYQYLLSTNSFINSLKNTIIITLVGTFLNLLVTFTFSYGLSKKNWPGRKIVLGLVILTLLLNAGIVPNFMLMKGLGLLNSKWALILSILTNASSILVVKSFMDAIPEELEEAARIDGYNDIGIFLNVIIPLSIPCIASFTLLFAVVHWNTYFNAVLYISDPNKWTVQVLVKMLTLDDGSSSAGAMSADIVSLPQETIRMASVILSMAPILAVYPFLQKYFVSGITLGALKE